MIYFYWVVYQYGTGKSFPGTGAAEVQLQEPITKGEQIQEISKWLLDRTEVMPNNHLKSIVVTNFILLRTEPDEPTEPLTGAKPE